jgi:hypothetical protein
VTKNLGTVELFVKGEMERIWNAMSLKFFRCYNRICGDELVNTTAEDFRQNTHCMARILTQDIPNI